MPAATMNPADSSKLWFLADALVSEPSRWRTTLDEFVAAGQALGTEPSPALNTALKGLREALASRSGHGLTKKRLQDAAVELLRKPEPVRNAGRALASALENARPSRQQAANE
jgi:hypothetical protein